MSDGNLSRSASEAAFQDADMQASQRGTDETVRIALHRSGAVPATGLDSGRLMLLSFLKSSWMSGSM